MKKTIIAAAIATVAAAPVMADVTISGQVKVFVADNDGQQGDWGYGDDSKINFDASEDLGNGLSAFAHTSLNTDAYDNAGTNNNGGLLNDMKAGFKGGFGTVVMGRMETLTQGAVSSMMDDGGHNNATSSNLETNLTGIGRVNALAYVSPTYSGFHAAVAGTFNGDNGVAGDDDDSGMFQHIDVAGFYDNGPLSIKLAHVEMDGAGPTQDGDITTMGASYKMGDLKLSAMSVDADAGTTAAIDQRDNMFRVDYALGRNSILLGHLDSDAANRDVTSIKLTHKFSKRTAVWVGHRDKGSAVATGDTAHMGMIHKF